MSNSSEVVRKRNVIIQCGDVLLIDEENIVVLNRTWSPVRELSDDFCCSDHEDETTSQSDKVKPKFPSSLNSF